MAQPLENESLGYNSPDGQMFGASSTKKIAFYGSTPVTRPVTASTLDVSSATSVSVSVAGVALPSWGFASQVEIQNLVVGVSTIQMTLKQLGLMA